MNSQMVSVVGDVRKRLGAFRIWALMGSFPSMSANVNFANV